LTYTNEHLPETLKQEDLQKFIKRLRRKYSDMKCKYYACGEYGDNFQRPHYHIIFFTDYLFELKLFKQRPDNKNLYISEQIQERWGLGYVTIGKVNTETIKYVASYSMKKLIKKSDYNGQVPEFQLVSLGMAKDFAEANQEYIRKYNNVLVKTDKGIIRKPVPQYMRKKAGIISICDKSFSEKYDYRQEKEDKFYQKVSYFNRKGFSHYHSQDMIYTSLETRAKKSCIKTSENI